MATPITTPGSNRDNCPKISTSCVIWQGPDIPCINLCAGDSIDEVVFKLATLLCDVTENVLDVTTLEFACLVTAGEANPATLLETLQAIINKICNIDVNGTTSSSVSRLGETTSSDPLVILPPCLYFNQDGDTVTMLPVTEYAAYLASVICTIITDISNLTFTVSNLTTRVIALENTVTDLSTYTYDIYVTSQCASAPSAGVTLLIQEAFSNLEASFCNLIGTTGISTVLIAAINRQCPGLSDLTQLSDIKYTMSQLSGWVTSPTTVADTITNLWLTMCDMRNSLVNYYSITPAFPCVLVVPGNLSVTTIGTTSSTITWIAPNYTGIQTPTGYRIAIFAWSGTAPTGPAVYNTTVTSPTVTKTFSNSIFTIGQNYVIYVYAIYSCGESNPASVVSTLIVPTILYKIKVTEANATNTTVPCVESGSPVTYTQTNKTTTVTLTNAITGSPVTNGTGSTMIIKLKYVVNSCAFYGPVYDEVSIAILNGFNNGTFTYPSNTYTNCGTALCTAVTKALSCGVSTGYINSEFDTTTISVC